MESRMIEYANDGLAGSYVGVLLLTTVLVISISCTSPDDECQEFYSKHRVELEQFVKKRNFDQLMQKDSLDVDDYTELQKMGVSHFQHKDSFLAFQIGDGGFMSFTDYHLAYFGPVKPENPDEVLKQELGVFLSSAGELGDNWYYYVMFYD